MVKGILIKDGKATRFWYDEAEELANALNAEVKDLGITNGLIIKYYAGCKDNTEKILVVYNTKCEEGPITGICHTHEGIEDELHGTLFVCEPGENKGFKDLTDKNLIQVASSIKNKMFIYTR